MKYRTCVLILGFVDFSAAWTQCSPSSISRRTRRSQSASSALFAKSNDLHEFDYLLQEQSTIARNSDESSSVTLRKQQMHHSGGSRRLIQLGRSRFGHRDPTIVVLTSSVATPRAEAVQGQERQAQQQQSTSILPSERDDFDPYADLDAQPQQHYSKIQAVPSSKTTLESRLKQMDLQDIVLTLVIPAIVSFAGLRWGFNKVAQRVADKSDTTLDSFAREMIHHDGDFEEMRACHADYSRQLLWMGPKKNEAMLKRYLAAYAKKKTVSPQAISTLSYVFTLFKLSEERAAQIMVNLCKEMGTDKISSAGKILFLGSRILKSPEGREALMPIKDMIKSTYRDENVAETLVETSQQAIGEAAYRSAVLAAGKNQKTLTQGWEVLGLDRDTATRIFNEEKKEGFVSDRETMYGGQTRKYDSKGRQVDAEGDLANPEEADEGENDNGEGNASNVYECQECGYTLFVAKGREFKFYGDDFKCPECGAKKDKFQPGNIED